MNEGEEASGHVFISYVREDAKRVDRLEERLQAAGITVWRDTSDLGPGQDWKIEIRAAIERGWAFIACFSENTERRSVSFQNSELVWAVEEVRRRPPGMVWLLPVRFADCQLPRFDLGLGRSLDSLQRVDLFDDTSWDAAMARLVTAVRQVQSALITSPSPKRGADMETEATVAYRDAVRGTVVVLRLTQDGSCRTCNGSNRTDSSCPACTGSGRETITQIVRTRIPAGVTDGQRLRVSGKGAPGKHGGPAGDLYVRVRVRNDDAEPAIPTRDPADVVRERLPYLQHMRNFKIFYPGTVTDSGLIGRLAECHYLEPGEEFLAIWRLDATPLRGNTDGVAFTTSKISISTSGDSFEIPYFTFKDFQFKRGEQLVQLPGTTPAIWLKISGPDEWSWKSPSYSTPGRVVECDRIVQLLKDIQRVV